jgi:hypothetical protein
MYRTNGRGWEVTRTTPSTILSMGEAGGHGSQALRTTRGAIAAVTASAAAAGVVPPPVVNEAP